MSLLKVTLQRIQTQAEAGRLPDHVTKSLQAIVDNTCEHGTGFEGDEESGHGRQSTAGVGNNALEYRCPGVVNTADFLGYVTWPSDAARVWALVKACLKLC